MEPCVQAFLPLLFAVANHYQVPLAEREDLMVLIFKDLRAYAPKWKNTGLPARVWVTGMAKHRCQTRPIYLAAD